MKNPLRRLSRWWFSPAGAAEIQVAWTDEISTKRSLLHQWANQGGDLCSKCPSGMQSSFPSRLFSAAGTTSAEATHRFPEVLVVGMGLLFPTYSARTVWPYRSTYFAMGTTSNNTHEYHESTTATGPAELLLGRLSRYSLSLFSVSEYLGEHLPAWHQVPFQHGTLPA